MTNQQMQNITTITIVPDLFPGERARNFQGGTTN
jgi:hypothetical protein